VASQGTVKPAPGSPCVGACIDSMQVPCNSRVHNLLVLVFDIDIDTRLNINVKVATYIRGEN
jgi:hypothetical protein